MKLFITGIDTDIGKTIVTGLLAKYLLQKGKSVITQKLAQTGCVSFSEDIDVHRKIMEIPRTTFDNDGITCTYIFKFPASPHLSANMECKTIDVSKINNATKILSENFEYLLIEGVGGIHVPLNNNITTLDYLEQNKLPIVIVSSGKLGSINHTLMTLELAKNRNIEVLGIIYNSFQGENEIIKEDSKKDI